MARAGIRPVLFCAACFLALLATQAMAEDAAIQPIPEFAPGEDVRALPAAFFRPSRPQNALEMIQRIPDFAYVEGDVTSDLVEDAGNVLIDGKRPSLEDKSLSAELAGIPAASVIRIELIRNGARGVDMGRWPVLANVVVRKVGVTRGSVSLTGSANPAGRTGASAALTLNHRVEQSTFDLGFEGGRTPSGGAWTLREQVRQSDGETVLATNQLSGGQGGRFVARAGYDTRLRGWRLRATGNLTFSQSERQNRTENLRFNTVSITDRSESSTRNRTAQLRADRELGPKRRLESQFNHNDTRSHSQSQSSFGRSFESNRDSGTRSARINLRDERLDQWVLETGLDYSTNWQGGQTLRRINGQIDGLPSASTDARRVRLQAFGSATRRLGTKLTLGGALRFDSTEVSTLGPAGRSRTFELWRPRFEAAWRFNPQTDLNLTLERGIEPVNLGNFISTVSRDDDEDEEVIIIGNTNLVPESNWTARARFQKRFGEGGLFSVQATHVALTDIVDRVLLISRTTDPDTGQVTERRFEATGNVGDGYRQNLEAQLNLPLERFGLVDGDLRLRATWRDSQMTDAFTDQERRFSNETPLSWSVGLAKGFDEGAFRTGFDASGTADQVSYRRGEISVSSRATLISAYAEYRPTDDITIRFDARDISSRLQATERNLYLGNDRTSDIISTKELRLSQSAPSYELSVRRSF